MRSCGCLIILLLGVAGDVRALTVALDGLAANVPPDITYTNGNGLPLELTLQLRNDSLAESPPVLLWQLRLQIDGEEAAVGSVLFESMAIPTGSLFDGLPLPEINSPTNDILASNADPLYVGIVMPIQSACSVLRLGFSVSEDAEGLFMLTMSGFDLPDPDHSSWWLSTGERAEPTPFENIADSTNTPGSVLAMIHVIRVPEPSSAVLLFLGTAAAARWLTSMWCAKL